MNTAQFIHHIFAAPQPERVAAAPDCANRYYYVLT
jgi:hypothetical protein